MVLPLDPYSYWFEQIEFWLDRNLSKCLGNNWELCGSHDATLTGSAEMVKRGGPKRLDEKFTVRTVMAMASELEEARRSVNRACVVFAALAASAGVSVTFEELSGK